MSVRLGRFYGGRKASPADAVGSRGFLEMPRILETRASAQLARIDISYLLPDVLDQGARGSCVAHAVPEAFWGALVRAWIERGRIGSPPECPCRAFTYWGARVIDGTPTEDVGTHLSSAISLFKDHGFPLESAWPYSDSGPLFPDKRDVATLERKARDQVVIEGTARISSRGTAMINDIRTALAAEHMVAFGTPVDMPFEELRPGQVWPGVTEQVLGGHALLIVGYDDNKAAFTIRNSWSRGWCDEGNCLISYDAAAEFDDVWIVSAAPAFTGTV